MSRDIFAFDFETTSNKPETTRVVQMAAMRESEVIFNCLCNPGLAISDGAYEVHGISNEMVANEPPDYEKVREMADYVIEHQDSIYLAGHNITTFDIQIMWKVAGITNPPDIPKIDTMICAIRTLPNAPNHKLSDLVAFLGLSGGEKAHDALGDIQMVFKLIERFKSALKMDTDELANWLATPRILTTCYLGKHKSKEWGRGAGKVPYFYAEWISQNFDPISKDLAATLKHHYGLNCKGVVL